MAKEKISRETYDTMRSSLLKKKNAKINLDDYEVDEPVSHHSNNNEDMKRTLKRKQNMKNTINEARIPANKQVGQHLFKGLRYDSNGNPLYTCDTLSNEEAQAMGWKFSPKYGLYGQLSDPTMFYESKKNTIRLTESDLKRVISESVKNVLKEGFNSPLPSFAAKEVEPKHRLRKQWDDDYDAMVARNHARGEEFMDDFNKKANLSYGKSLKEDTKSFDFKKELFRLTQNYLRELYGYADGCRDSIDNDMELNDAIYQTIESVTNLRDSLKLDEPFKRGMSQGNLSFTDITGDI